MKKFFLVTVVLIACMTCIFAVDRPSVAVVLSGGGAKGIAHVAVLEKLEELGIPIDMVLGTSMGSLIGGLYAAGYSPNDIRELIAENDLTELFTTIETSGYKPLKEAFNYDADDLSISLGSGVMGISGFIDDYKIMNFFYKAIGNVPKDIDFDDLPTPFRCIGANAVTGKRIVFDHGDIIDCMRASMSIPLVFPTKVVEGEMYVDGGLVDNMPVDVAKELGYDIVIAVDVNAKFDITQEDYKSISGTLGALFRVIVNNTINEQKKHADLLLEPDLRGIGTLSFGIPDEIIKRGTDEVTLKEEQLKALADLFPEQTKVYKNPKRKGMYFTKYVTTALRVKKSSAESKMEKALHQTRLSFGLALDGGFNYNFKGKFSALTLIPEFRIQFFLRNIGNSEISSDTKFSIGRIISLNQKFLFPLVRPSKGDSFFLTLSGSGSLGSLSAYTDRDLKTGSINKTEYKWHGGLGVKVTDERTHNIDFSANVSGYNLAQFLYVEESAFSDSYNYFHPYGEVAAIWYGNGAKEGQMASDLRLDFLGDAGMFRKNFTYKMVLAAEKEWAISKNDGIWFDVIAHSTREPMSLKDSYVPYGGWTGMPGYTVKHNYADYVMAGIGWDRLLKKGIVSKVFVLEVRGGIRSEEDRYTGLSLSSKISKYPFADMAEHLHWDIGLGAAIDFRGTVFDLKLGAGFNKDLMLGIYAELK